jgi:dTDP-4-amino-4,6-dideoxygalactose transaminase
MYISGQPESEALTKLLKAQKLFRFQGKDILTQCQTFENQFATLLNTSHSLLVTSGTNALILALEALDLEPGDEVLVPAFTFFATIAAITSVQAVPVIINIDESLTIDVEEARSQITPRTKAIIAVHMDGLPSQMIALSALAQEKKIALIEDVAQAVGGSYQGQRLGTFGRFGCFSFNVDKIISCGEGGAIAMNDLNDYKHVLNLHDSCCPFGATHKESFQAEKIVIGHSMRVSELSGALMVEQLKRLDSILENLRATKSRAMEKLKQDGVKTNPINCVEGDCATSLYLKFKSPQELLEAGKGITDERVQTVPIHIRPAHAFWQWIHLLKNQQFSKPHLNPFRYSTRDPKKLYHPIHFTPTVEILSTSLKVVTPYFEAAQKREEWVAYFMKKVSSLGFSCKA